MKNKILKLSLLSLITFCSIHAKEVVDSEIDKDLVMINLGVFHNVENAQKIVQHFHNDYDIYTGFFEDRYYQYLVNIESSHQHQVLADIRNFISDAYFVNKKSFDYGVKLLDNVNKDSATVESHLRVNDEAFLPFDIAMPQEVDQKKSNESIDKTPPVATSKEEPTLASALKSETFVEEDQSYEIDGLVKVDLIDAVLQTLSRSHRLQAAREKMIQAKRDIDIGYADFKPTVDATYSISENRKEPGDRKEDQTRETSKRYNEERYSLTINQNIFAGGESVANINRLKADYLIAKNDYRGLIESEITKAINAYFDIVFRREALQVNEKNIEQLQTIFELVQAKFESGALSIGELSSVEASISNAMSQLSRTKSRYNNAIEYYRFITGRMFENTYPYQKEVDMDIEDFELLEQKALVNNNKLVGLTYLIASKNQSLKMTQAAFRPKIDLQLTAQKTTDQENYRFDENEYMARLSFSYNLYSGGRDRASFLKAFSAVRESGYEKEAEIREILWNLEKLHTSLMSLQESIQSVKNEVASSQSMVDSYWEGFRYGEQDLHLLLQAQRQLNTAELDLIDSQLGSVTDFFKILEVSGELIEYFGIDIEHDNFLDMAQGRYHERVRKIAANKEQEPSLPFSIQKSDEALEEEQVEEVVQKSEVVEKKDSSIKELLSFAENFLIENPEFMSIVFEDFADTYEALQFISETEIEGRAFIYNTLKDDKVMTHLAYGVFENDADAQAVLKEGAFTDFVKKGIEKIGSIQSEWKQFNQMALMPKQEVVPTIVKKQVAPKPFETDPIFKERFLSADANHYTINVTTFQSIDDAARVVKSQNIADNSFVFAYGDSNSFVKLMYGVYVTYDEAVQALESMGTMKSTYMPVIERINLKQRLYKRYNQ